MSRHAGTTLVELIIAILIISVSVIGILGVMTLTTGHSPDTMIRKQSIAIAESLMEEIELRDVSAVAATTPVNITNRLNVYHAVNDYNGFSTNGIYAADGTPVSGVNNYNLSKYNVSVITSSNRGGDISVAVASAVQITVLVTDPMGNTTRLDGYRASY